MCTTNEYLWESCRTSTQRTTKCWIAYICIVLLFTLVPEVHAQPLAPPQDLKCAQVCSAPRSCCLPIPNPRCREWPHGEEIAVQPVRLKTIEVPSCSPRESFLQLFFLCDTDGFKFFTAISIFLNQLFNNSILYQLLTKSLSFYIPIKVTPSPPNHHNGTLNPPLPLPPQSPDPHPPGHGHNRPHRTLRDLQLRIARLHPPLLHHHLRFRPDNLY